EDKVTCNAQDASEATWNSGWLSAVRYASTSQTTTPPGSLGTFSYNILAPVGVAAGIYHFNGDVVLASTGERIHPEGYFQDANTGAAAGAATLTSLTPTTGSANGGTTVSIAGSGIVCNPTFPTVSFGGTNGIVTSCGATALTVTTPAHAPGAVTVTVTNPGGGASNGLTFSFADTTTPKFNSFTVSGNLVTITWSEAVCKPAILAGGPANDWTIMNIATSTTNTVLADSTPTCNAALDNAVTTSTLQLSTAMPNGAFVETTLNTVGASGTRNADFQDIAGNTASAPQARQATATAPETTQPVLVSAQGAVGATSVTLTFSEPIYCVLGLAAWDFGTPAVASTDISLSDGNAATVDPTVTGAGTNACGTSPTTADTSFSALLSFALPADRTYTLTVTPDASTEIRDIVGNPLGDGAGNACYLIVGGCSIAFTTGAGDFTPPTIVDARMVNNLGTSDFGETVGDSFSATFSEAMNGTTTGVLVGQDQDGSVITMTCGGNVSCSWNTAVTTVTVTMVTATVPPIIGLAGSGTTPGFQIPFNITALTGFTDLQGNVPNVLGSSDRLVDYE
ncbi:MAG: IPT/TIG domain-containing protein, partial [Actinomycetota bacterium]|nr:IPT/TIG domain-containing protein [Actinomycetota bacterium]